MREPVLQQIRRSQLLPAFGTLRESHHFRQSQRLSGRLAVSSTYIYTAAVERRQYRSIAGTD